MGLFICVFVVRRLYVLGFVRRGYELFVMMCVEWSVVVEDEVFEFLLVFIFYKGFKKIGERG